MFLRWLPTFLAFPLASLLAVSTVGSVRDVPSALAAGAVVGAVLGTAQWLALRWAGFGSRGLGPRWILTTAVATSLGAAAAAAITGAGTSVGQLVTTGAVTGLVVGAAQGVLLARAARRAGAVVVMAWALTVGAAWALGWFVTSQVIVDADRGYVTFGSSGAVLATLLTGLVLRALVGPRTAVAPAPVVVAGDHR